MGRELRRVPLDFQWPENKVWHGYINPYRSEHCPDCKNGWAPQAQLYYDQWYGCAPFDPIAYGAEPITRDMIRPWAQWQCDRKDGYHCTMPVEEYVDYLMRLWKNQWSHHLIQADVDALIADNRLWNFTRVPRDGGQALVRAIKMGIHNQNSWLPESNGYVPSAREVNKWSIGGLGHDSSNAYICVRARCEREGYPVTCATCDGTAHVWPDPEIKRQHDAWEDFEPPTGDGYQLWETTSEGSPVSPVFSTLDALCKYAARHCTTFGNQRTTAERWREMLDNEHVYHQEGNMVFL